MNTNKPTISVVLSVYNEEKILTKTLLSVTWADEIVVVNNSSTDSTEHIARKYTTRVYTVKNNPMMLNINKNIAIGKATGDWIVYLDGDEVITSDGKEEILRTIIHQQKHDGYFIPRKNIIFGKWIQYGLWWPDKQLRLFRNGKGTFPCRHIHEQIHVDGSTSELKEPYVHYNYKNISQYLTKLDRCTSSESEYLQKANKTLHWYDAIRFPLSDFLKIYFSQNGWKDGLHGLVLAILQSFYAFVVFAKTWESRNFYEENIKVNELEKEAKQQCRDIRYWIHTTKIGLSDSPLTTLWLKIKRKF